MKRFQVTKSNEKWLRDGVIKSLIEDLNYKKKDAVELFNESKLLKTLYEDPEYIFHFHTSHWAKHIDKIKRYFDD